MNGRKCPECGSSDVEPDRSRSNQAGRDFANINKWTCNECGYRGLMPLED